MEFTGGANTTHNIIADPTGRSNYVLEMHNPTGGGNRARMERFIAGLPDPDNLPADGMYRGWFYLADNQSSNNIFQFKQSIKHCLRPGDNPGPCTTQTRDVFHWIRVNHTSGGVHDIYMRGSARLDGNRWNADGSAPTTYAHGSIAGAVQRFQWHFLEVRFKWSSTDFGVGPGDGNFTAWIDGSLIANASFVTQWPTVQTGTLPAHLGAWVQPGLPTYTSECRQTTWNNYGISGNTADTRIYWDDLSISELN